MKLLIIKLIDWITWTVDEHFKKIIFCFLLFVLSVNYINNKDIGHISYGNFSFGWIFFNIVLTPLLIILLYKLVQDTWMVFYDLKKKGKLIEEISFLKIIMIIISLFVISYVLPASMGYLTDTLINVISYSFKIQLDLIAVVIGYFLIVIFICLIYLIPTFIAHNRKHHNTLAIFLTNLLLGFTIIGWIAALIWSVTKPPQNNGKSDG